MKKLLGILSFLLFSGCNTYLHILEVKSNVLQVADDIYVFENDSLIVSYSFWDEKGVIAFRVQNKTAKPLYIDWKKSSFVADQDNLSYWEDSEYRATKTRSKSTGYSFSPKGNPFFADDVRFGASTHSSSSTTTISRPERITSLAPSGGVFKAEYYITPEYNLSLYNYKPIEYPSIIKRGKTTTLQVSEFDLNSSPIIFKNFLVFSFNNDFKDEFYLDHSFFVSKITEVLKDEAIIIVPDVEVPIELNRFKNHYSFYNVVKSGRSVSN